MTFKSTHEDRDKALPNAREQILRMALNDLELDPEVIGVYLAGSLAKKNADNYSDIDLHIVVTRTSFGAFVDQKRERPIRWGSVLFYEDDNPRLPVAVVTFDTFVKVDIWYHQSDEILPSLWLSGCHVLYDPRDIIQPAIDWKWV